MPFPNPAENLTPGQALLDAPVPELIRSLGLAIAEAQAALDQNSIKTATTLGTAMVEFDQGGGNVVKKSLLELGFTPVFYHFTESTLEISLSLSLRVEESFGFDVDVSIGNLQSVAKTATGSVEILDNEALADGDSVKIKDTTLTVGTGAGTFAKGEAKDSATTATNLAAAINAADDLESLVTATASENKVTLQAKEPGAKGNLTITASKPAALGAKSMTGGKDAVPAAGGTGGTGGTGDAGSTAEKVKQVVPFGIAINANYHRKYEFDMSGASKITAKMVSLPGPVEFLDEIKAYYSK